ncbi:Utp21 specific WD40 associated putative domain-containing protein [Lipomyces doorenjongii]|uniref:Utp21 specific WD40 associated putative domain-containing protein n=1 Tax=Lipomyces doorenjongii TaxID=383834 RepID=UPI0034CF5D00
MPSVSVTLDTDAIKRRKLASDLVEHKARLARRHTSRIFSPFRSIGYVTNEVPFSISTLGQTFIITTVVGNSFQIYDAGTLHLLFVSTPQTSAPISAVSTHFHFVHAIWGTTVGVFRRGRLEYSVESGSNSPLKKLLIFGDYVCASSNEIVYIFRFNTPDKSVPPELYTSITLPPGAGDIVKLVHPHTYLNKIVVATTSYVLLFNIRTGNLVFQSKPFETLLTDIDVAPVLDTLGLAFSDGKIQTYDIRYDKVLCELSCRQKVTSISFRTDGNAHLAAGTADGDLYFYDLNRKRRVHILRDVHSAGHGGISSVSFLNGQPVFVTSGGDNSLKEYVFDPEISTSTTLVISPPRHLRSRGGHSQPSMCLFFTEESGHFLLSASLDRSLWTFSLRKDAQSHELSQREKGSATSRKAGLTSSLREKFPQITAVAYEGNKQGDWENIITAHKDQAFARTWDGQRGIVGRWQLKTSDKGVVRSVGISFCGNFGLVGSAYGSIDAYNLQSGIHRKRFRSHKRAVTGVALDSLNRTVISCGLDSELHFHDFKTTALNHKLHLPSPATSLLLHRSTDMLAVAMENCQIFIIDITTMRVVRELKGHSKAITAFDFSADGRWIVSASLDSTIRTWDLPTGTCIDAIKVESIVTALRLSGNGEWLATAHEEGVGINLWTNRTMFKQVAFRQITDQELERVAMPTISGEGAGGLLEGAFSSDGSDAEDGDVSDSGNYVSPEQLNQKLLTLSLAPRNRYMTLINLDIIKQRNKPKEAPKAPEKAPFFLTLTGAQPAEKKEDGPAKARRKSGSSKITEFRRKLIEGHAIDDYTAFVSYLKTLSPSAIDLEFRSLDALEIDQFAHFVSALTAHIEMKRDYELVQAWMSMFLRIHGDVIVENREVTDLNEALTRWQEVEQKEKKRLDELVGYCNGVVKFLRLD